MINNRGVVVVGKGRVSLFKSCAVNRETRKGLVQFQIARLISGNIFICDPFPPNL